LGGTFCKIYDGGPFLTTVQCNAPVGTDPVLSFQVPTRIPISGGIEEIDDLKAPAGYTILFVMMKAGNGGIRFDAPATTTEVDNLFTSYCPHNSQFLDLSNLQVCVKPFQTPPTPAPVKVTPAPVKPTKPTKAPTKGYGDPHFVTWNGEKFDFHGECDLVFIQNPHFRQGLGLNIHMRTKMRRNWSFVDVAVIQIGDDILEVKGGQEEHYWINQVEYDATPTAVISGFNMRYKLANKKQRVFIIDLEQGQSIEIRTYKDFVGVTVHGATDADFGASVGITGEFGSGRKLGRDGKEIEDLIAYGQDWQVMPSDGLLFRTLEGPQYPLEQCRLPSTFAGTARRRRLGENTAKLELARQACAEKIQNPEDFDSCVFDVLLTDDAEMAGAF
jgi:von Willebrand factor type D domain